MFYFIHFTILRAGPLWKRNGLIYQTTATSLFTSGQDGVVDKVAHFRHRLCYEHEKRRLSASSHALYHSLEVQCRG